MTRSPLGLPHRLDGDAFTCRAVIETPAGSDVKFSFDADAELYTAGKLLPLGLAMPLDFGFVPSTRGGDGDPIDLMVMNEARLTVGCLVTVRLLGAIEVEQVATGAAPIERNDRIVARLTDSRVFAEVDRLDQLGEAFVSQLNSFFQIYKNQRGQSYHVLSVGGPERATELIASATLAVEDSI